MFNLNYINSKKAIIVKFIVNFILFDIELDTEADYYITRKSNERKV